MCMTHLDRIARFSWRGLLILNYHRIGVPGPQDDPDLFSATLDGLEEHIKLLATRFEIVPAGVADLDLDRPARRVAITFDDGYRDQMAAARLLRRHGVTASFFISTGFVDSPRHAWWDEIAWLTRGLDHDLLPSPWLPAGLPVRNRSSDQVRRSVNDAFKQRAGADSEAFLNRLADEVGMPRMDDRSAEERWMRWTDVRELTSLGMEVGGHTVNHPVLSSLPPERQHIEIAECLHRLREQLPTTVDTFAYPVGSRSAFDDRTTSFLGPLGVRRAFSFCGGVNPPRMRGEREHDLYNVLRAGVYHHYSPAMVRLLAALPQLSRTR
jgi:peptidoglycan/xylan/chitin deacetylase (PgdA/CDA1 family)